MSDNEDSGMNDFFLQKKKHRRENGEVFEISFAGRKRHCGNYNQIECKHSVSSRLLAAEKDQSVCLSHEGNSNKCQNLSQIQDALERKGKVKEQNSAEKQEVLRRQIQERRKEKRRKDKQRRKAKKQQEREQERQDNRVTMNESQAQAKPSRLKRRQDRRKEWIRAQRQRKKLEKVQIKNKKQRVETGSENNNKEKNADKDENSDEDRNNNSDSDRDSDPNDDKGSGKDEDEVEDSDDKDLGKMTSTSPLPRDKDSDDEDKDLDDASEDKSSDDKDKDSNDTDSDSPGNARIHAHTSALLPNRVVSVGISEADAVPDEMSVAEIEHLFESQTSTSSSFPAHAIYTTYPSSYTSHYNPSYLTLYPPTNPNSFATSSLNSYPISYPSTHTRPELGMFVPTSAPGVVNRMPWTNEIGVGGEGYEMGGDGYSVGDGGGSGGGGDDDDVGMFWGEMRVESGKVAKKHFVMNPPNRKRCCTLGSCVVCLSEFHVGEEATILKQCKHAFHKDCIMPWIREREQPTCPICRQTIPRSNGTFGPS